MKRAEIEKLFDGKLAENVEIKDIVDADWLELVQEDVRTFLHRADI